MSIRLKIAGARKREKSELISFATCRSFYTKQFDSSWYCSAPHSKVVNPRIIFLLPHWTEEMYPRKRLPRFTFTFHS